MIANFNHNHQKIFGASWKAVILAFPVVWGKKVGRGGTTERRTYPCTQVQSKATKGYAEYTGCTVKNKVSSFQRYMMPIDLKTMQGLNICYWICHCVTQSKAG
jgi:hypothetical protein